MLSLVDGVTEAKNLKSSRCQRLAPKNFTDEKRVNICRDVPRTHKIISRGKPKNYMYA